MLNYKKFLALTITLILLISSYAFAAAEAPQSFWITPPDAKVGDDVVLNAFVYNNSIQDVTVTVAFTNGADNIQSSTVVVPKETGKTVTAKWIVSDSNAQLSASVTSAIGKDKKHVSNLEGNLGSVSIGGNVATVSTDFFSDGFFKGVLASIENFRQTQADRYTKLRDITKVIVEKPGVDQVEKFLAPDYSDKVTMTDSSTEIKNFPGQDSVTLVFATAAASFFGHRALFYLASIFLAFLVIRFIFRLF